MVYEIKAIVSNFELLGGCRCQSSNNIFQVHEPEETLFSMVVSSKQL